MKSETVTLTLRDNGWGVLYIEEKDGRLFETVTLTLRENGWGVLYIEEKDARLSMCLYNRDWGRLCTLKGKIGPLAYSKGRNGFHSGLKGRMGGHFTFKGKNCCCFIYFKKKDSVCLHALKTRNYR